MYDPNRPVSITIIGSTLTIHGVVGLVWQAVIFFAVNGELVLLNRSGTVTERRPLIVGIFIAGYIISIIVGLGMLKGKNWSRYLLIGAALATIFTALAYAANAIPIGIFSILLLAPVFSPSANAYFVKREKT